MQVRRRTSANARCRARAAARRRKVRQYLGDSKRFVETDWAGQCDVVFVDGSHAYSYVESDTEKALRMVKPGGIVFWHDYRPGPAGRDVRRYLDSRYPELPLVCLEGTRIVAPRAPSEPPENRPRS